MLARRDSVLARRDRTTVSGGAPRSVIKSHGRVTLMNKVPEPNNARCQNSRRASARPPYSATHSAARPPSLASTSPPAVHTTRRGLYLRRLRDVARPRPKTSCPSATTEHRGPTPGRSVHPVRAASPGESDSAPRPQGPGGSHPRARERGRAMIKASPTGSRCRGNKEDRRWRTGPASARRSRRLADAACAAKLMSGCPPRPRWPLSVLPAAPERPDRQGWS